MATQPTVRLTEAEYLEQEHPALDKSEYRDGEVVPMPGVSRAHALITINFLVGFGTRLADRPCEVYSGDMRVRVAPARLYTYPDATVVCGTPLFADDRTDTLLNPTVIVEVLSPSTQSYDRGEKFGYYRKLESLRDYVLASQETMLIEHYARQPDGEWLPTVLREPEQVLSLSSITCELPLSEIYRRVVV